MRPNVLSLVEVNQWIIAADMRQGNAGGIPWAQRRREIQNYAYRKATVVTFHSSPEPHAYRRVDTQSQQTGPGDPLDAPPSK